MRYRVVIAAPVAVVAMAVTGLGPLALPASAAPLPAPSVSFVTTPTPTVTWPVVDGAVRYRVIFKGPSATVEEFDTVATVAAPTRDLPIGSGSVTVSAIDDQNVSGDPTVQNWVIGERSAPVITAPVTPVQGPPGNLGGVPSVPTISYPTPPVLSWAAVDGARSYDVQVTSTGTTLNYTTAGTSVVPTDTLALAVQGVDKIWSWTVRSRSNDDILSAPAAGEFRVVWPAAPTLDDSVTPDDIDAPIDLPNTPAQSDTTLKWDPVPGAQAYQLQVYLSNDFADESKRKIDTVIRATRFSPNPEINNASYWWRVRAVYPGGAQFGEWSEVWKFQRKWGKQTAPTMNPAGGSELSQLGRPTGLTPASGASVSDNDVVMRWMPVVRASRYEVQWRAIDDASWDNKPACGTFHTSFTPQGPCGPGPGTWEWRVRAIDDGTAVSNWSHDDIPGDPAAPVITLAARSGALVPVANFKGTALTTYPVPVADVQELSWPRVSSDANPGVEYTSYRVDLALDESFTNIPNNYVFFTRGTRLVPPVDLVDNNVGQAYYYRVVPCGPGGCLSNANAASGSFSKRGTKTIGVSVEDAHTGAPVTDNAPATDQVRIVWTPRGDYALNDGAIRGYRVQVSTQPDFSAIIDQNVVDQPWYVTPNTLYPNTINPNDKLYVRVQTLSGDGQGLAWSDTYTFRKTSAVVSGLKATAGPTCGSTAATSFVRSPLLCWAPSALTDVYRAQIKRGTDVVADVTTRYAAWSFAGTLQPGTYTWAALRRDVVGQESAWTPGGSFSVGIPAPTRTDADGKCREPAIDAAVVVEPVAGGSARYRVQIDNAGDSFSSLVEQRETPYTKFVPRENFGWGTFEWRVIALNADGQSSTVPSSTSATATIGVQTPPEAPNGPALTREGLALQVVWQTPVAGGSPITEYRLRYRAAGQPSWAVVADIAANQGTRTITGLAEQTTYNVQVGARNALGWGRWSNTSTVTTPVKPDTVGVPALTNLGGGKVRVNWGGPNDGGSPITKYEVQHRIVGQAWPLTISKSVTAPTTTVDLTGLTGGVAYDVQVRAVNAVGAGLYGTSQKITVALPGIVSSLTAARKNRSAVIAWGTPSVLAGEQVTGYQLRIRSRAASTTTYGAWSSAVATASTVRSRSYSGLTPLRVYQVEVRAKALSGLGAARYVAFAAIGTPGTPAWQSLASSSGKVTAVAKAPATNGAAITKYVFQVKVGSVWKSYSSSSRVFVWSGGVKGRSYSFRVAAVNAAGQSSWSLVKAVVVK